MQEIQKVKFDFDARENASRKVLAGCIPGAEPYHHTVLAGSSLVLEPFGGHHVLIVLKGEAKFSTDGNEYMFHERVVFVPSPSQPVAIDALTDLQILEVRWFKREDTDASRAYTEVPESFLTLLEHDIAYLSEDPAVMDESYGSMAMIAFYRHVSDFLKIPSPLPDVMRDRLEARMREALPNIRISW